MNLTVLGSIFRRDFTSYFSNPTGYVFICLFVMMSAAAAFIPPEFFNNNLANLDQLSRWMPFILLLFVPAITMSTWAEEKRQGTDELLLTMPATDFDVVLGKYLAALAIYTVSLLFSMFSVFLVFNYGLGFPDLGLFACTYFGYWLVGGALLSIGMVASFLTRNLTVGFVLGLIFLAPFAVAGVADWIVKDPAVAQAISRWSVAYQFQDFQRGVITFSGLAYFVSLAAVMLYLCMVLIGRRHWGTGEEGDNRWAHYFARFALLLVTVGGLNAFFSNYDLFRVDTTSEQINSLSEQTKKMVRQLAKDDVKPISVDVYLSPNMPSEYAAHKLNIIGTLREIESLSGGKVQSNVYQIETFSEQAETAERSYGIVAQNVQTTTRGRPDEEEIFAGLAVTSGLDKVVVPFLDKGISPEYELVRSIMTVADTKRKRVGVVNTGVQLFGGFSMQAGSVPKSQLIVELEKQYEVVEVNPNEPITDTYDVLLAVQPSQLTPPGMNNLIAAIRAGQPVAVFEDPSPLLIDGAIATAEPNRAGGGPMAMFGGGGQEIPKGDLSQLWDLLGVRLLGESTSLLGGPRRIDVIMQDFNPYPEYDLFFSNQFVFIDESLAETEAVAPFNVENTITSGLRQVLFLRPGALLSNDLEGREVVALTNTGKLTATIPYMQLQRVAPQQSVSLERIYTNESYVMAAAIEGEMKPDEDLSLTAEINPDESSEEKTFEKTPLKAVVVADIDCLGNAFFGIRAQGNQGDGVNLNFQNVTFVLNTLDWLAGDDRYIEIRKRSKAHRVLTLIDERTKEYREDFRETQQKAEEALEEAVDAANEELTEAVAKIEARQDLDPREKEFKIQQIRRRLQDKISKKEAQLQRDRDREVRKAQRTLDQQVSGVQNQFKALALLIPPIPPILLGLFVFFHRQSREREGVSKRRLRFVSENEPAAPSGDKES